MRHSLRHLCLAAGLISALGTSVGCAEPLPEEGLIITNRALAIRTEVTAPLPDVDPDPMAPPRAEALPFETVRLTPYLVGAKGPVDPTTLSPVWIACELQPGGSLFSCLDAALPLELDDIPACEVPDFSQLMGDDIPAWVSPCIISRDTAPDFVVPLAAGIFLGSDLEITMISGPGSTVDDPTSTEDCAAPLLAGDFELPNDCLFAVQRLSLGPLDRLFLLLADFGALPPEIELPDPASVRDGDRNPRIERIEVIVIHDDGTAEDPIEVVSGDTVQAMLGDTLRVTTVSPEEDLQFYDISVNNGESTQEEREAYQGAWFRTWGRILSDSSDDPESFNEWILDQGSQDELESPADDEAWLYYVVRDGRQGVNWWNLRVQITDSSN